jgi:aryl-alcohol dehydrogenase-like predicted oxidoreductase
METRRLGRIGHESTVLIYGAAALSDVDQETADRSIQEALDAGINHFDVAASYGKAETLMGPSVPAMRDRIFLASKTGDRDAESAWASINRSLELLRTDRLDLIQLHAVGDLDELDKCTGKGGALEAALRAREEGLVSYVGITGHGHEAPATHLEALRRFSFDTVLTPWNYALSKRPAFAHAFAALRDEAVRQDVGLMIIKSVAKRNWQEDQEHTHATWYEPLVDANRIRAAVSWVLGEQGPTGLATAADVRLLKHFVAAEADRMPRDQAADALEQVPDLESPFISIPI